MVRRPVTAVVRLARLPSSHTYSGTLQNTTVFREGSAGSLGGHANPSRALPVRFIAASNLVRQRRWACDSRWRFFDGYELATSLNCAIGGGTLSRFRAQHQLDPRFTSSIRRHNPASQPRKPARKSSIAVLLPRLAAAHGRTPTVSRFSCQKDRLRSMCARRRMTS